MEPYIERQALYDGVHFTAIRKAKFKFNILTVNFVMPLYGNDVSSHAAIPFLIENTCIDLKAGFAELYGAQLQADVRKCANQQILSLGVKCLDRQYALKHEDITVTCVNLLMSAILGPMQVGTAYFNVEKVNQHRDALSDAIKTMSDDPKEYAISQCIRYIYPDNPMSDTPYGDYRSLQQMTRESVAAGYQRILHSSRIKILLTGPADSEYFVKQMIHAFGFRDSVVLIKAPRFDGVAYHSAQNVLEVTSATQSRVVFGLCKRENCEINAEVAQTFAILFGGSPVSKLFLTVREHLNLCYSCKCHFDTPTGLIYVDIGTHLEHVETIKQQVRCMLSEIQMGNFSEDALTYTKTLIRSSLASINDCNQMYGDIRFACKYGGLSDYFRNVRLHSHPAH